VCAWVWWYVALLLCGILVFLATLWYFGVFLGVFAGFRGVWGWYNTLFGGF